MGSATRCFVVLLLSAVSVGSFYLAQRVNSVAQLQVVPPTQDFGHVQQGVTLKANTLLANDTGRSIELGTALGSCRCATVEDLGGCVLAPGASIEVPVTWDISGKRGPVSADMVFDYYLVADKEAISTAAINARGAKLFVSFRAFAYVEPEYFISPDRLAFASDKNGELCVRLGRNEKSTLISNHKLRIVDFGSNHEAVSIRKTNPQHDRTEEVLVTFNPSLWSKKAAQNHLINLKIELIVASDYEPVIVIPVDVVSNTDPPSPPLKSKL